MKLKAYFLLLIVLCTYGNRIFQKEALPYVLLLVTLIFSWLLLLESGRVEVTPKKDRLTIFSPQKWGWLHALAGVLSFVLLYEELRKIWAKHPNPGSISDVLPQLESMSTRLWSSQNPYQEVVLPTHTTFPVYMPLHFSPIGISQGLGIDIRWSGFVLLAAAVGLLGYVVGRNRQSWSSVVFMFLLSVPVWFFIFWQSTELAISLETIVASWYICLLAGLFTRNFWLIGIGITGVFLSRYSGLFWVPFFAFLLWTYEKKSISIRLWGAVSLAGFLLFVLPFWMRDPQLLHKILAYYEGCTYASWVRPDVYTFMAGLSMNIHLRQWIPGDKEITVHFSHYPQIFVQLLTGVLAVYFYQKKWKSSVDIYTYSAILLFLMVMLFYCFSPMLFRYYMLVPLVMAAALIWKIKKHLINSNEVPETKSNFL